MTSWIQTPRRKKVTEDGPPVFHHQTSERDILVEFNDYFDACVFVANKKGNLTISDAHTSIGPGFQLFQATFVPQKGVRFVDVRSSDATAVARRRADVNAALRAEREGDLQAFGHDLFTVREDLQAQIDAWNQSHTLRVVGGGGTVLGAAPMPSKLHFGVQVINRGGLGGGSISSYHTMIRAAARVADLSGEVTILLYGASDTALLEFARGADARWRIYGFPPAPGTEGSTRGPSRQQRIEGFVQQMAELQALQGTDTFVGSLATPLGRFLWLSRGEGAEFQVMDGSSWA